MRKLLGIGETRMSKVTVSLSIDSNILEEIKGMLGEDDKLSVIINNLLEEALAHKKKIGNDKMSYYLYLLKVATKGLIELNKEQKGGLEG